MKLWLSHIGSAVYILIEDPKRYGYVEANLISLKRKHKRRRIRISDFNGSKTYLTFPSRYKYCYMNDQYVEGKVIYYHQVWEKC